VGSNIFNVLFILGLSAVIAPLVVSEQIVRKEVPLTIGVSLVLWAMAASGSISRWEGGLLFAGIAGYTGYLIWQARREGEPTSPNYERELGARGGRPRWAVQVALVIAGLALLVLGSRWLVEAAVSIARMLGWSELIIGLTIVAAGTSLPEVAASVMAALKGERDIAVGNVVGSSIFNILGVLGAAALVSPAGLEVAPALLRFDIPVMVAVAVACLPIFYTDYRIARWEGLLFLGYYACYTAYLILAASHHDALPGFTLALTAVVLPLTAITVVVLALRARRQA
jgi:cation:H+ antiporter